MLKMSWNFIIKYLVVHCSASPDNPIKNDTETIKYYHMRVKNWSDIAYHQIVESINNIWQKVNGRPLNRPGGHVLEQRMNFLSWGVCLAGGDPWLGFSDKYPITKGQWDKLVEVLAELCEMAKLSPSRIMLHRDYADYKPCPGYGIDREELRQAVADFGQFAMEKVEEPIINPDDYVGDWRKDPRTIKKGDINDGVKIVQKVLGIEVDGVFGPQTDEAVKRFQSKIGLTPDGWVGPKTWREIFKRFN